MTELFERSFSAALQAGISVFDYWNLTWDEISEVIKAHQKSILLNQKQRAIMDHAFMCMLGRMLDGKRITLYEAYPNLFEDESREFKINKAKQTLLQYASAHNKGVDK